MKVLYVDDDFDIREIAELALGLDPEFDVATASSGEDALAHMADAVPDVALLDVMMPGMDGPTLLQRMRADARLAGVPVIFVTARAQKSELQSFAMLDARGVIAKPFDPITLAAQVRALMP